MTTQTNFKVENYNELKNYIHNYLGLTKEEIKNIINDVVIQTVSIEVEKYFNDKQRLEHLIEKEVLRQVKYNSDYERRSFIVNTMDEIYNKIDKVIHEEVLRRLQITLKELDEVGGDE